MLRWSKISRGLRKCYFCVSMRGVSVHTEVHQAAQGWLRTSTPCTNSSSLSQGLRCSPTSELPLPLFSAGSEQNPVFFHPPKRGGTDVDLFQDVVAGSQLQLRWITFSWCCAELGELPQERSFHQRFFFFNNNPIKLHIEIRIQSIRFMLIVDYF